LHGQTVIGIIGALTWKLSLLPADCALAIFQTDSMLAGGVSNRLLLSLRSGIPKEVDYALDLFVQYSYTDAAVIPLDALPGLPLALLELVRPSPARDNETIRRRTEAALVLRNFVLEGGPRCIETVRPFVDTVFEVLVEVIEADAERSTELVLYMLDLAEVYASTCRLLPSDFDAPLENQLPAQKLYSLLAQIAQINDRALIIAAYTLLSALAMNPNNAPVFASQATLRKSHAAHPDCPPTNLVKRAIALLPLKDNEILLPVLEFLYQHTLNPVNAARLLQTQNMRQIIRAVVSHIQEGAREEQVEYEVLEGSGHGHNHRGKAMREALIEAYPSLNSQQASSASPSSPPEPLMDPEDLQAILFLPEPQRAHAWWGSFATL
jgi:chromatin structure-remodeling complex subunit RSC9